MAICLRVLESVKVSLTGFALLVISGMNLAQNTGLMFPNFRLQGLVYMSEVVYCCSLQPNPFFSGVLQSFRVQVFPPVLPYREPVMCHHTACQGQEGNRNVPPWMCQKPNTLTNMSVYHPYKITCTNHIYWYIRNIYMYVWIMALEDLDCFTVLCRIYVEQLYVSRGIETS